MPALSDIFEAHSRRITLLTQHREARLAASAAQRDRDLRALPQAAKLYAAFDKQIADAMAARQATDAKAEAVRASAFDKVASDLSEALADAHRARRDADVAAFEKRRRAEDAAEHEFVLAIGAGASKPASTEAQKVRAEKLARARKDFEDDVASAHEQFRKSRDAALIAENRSARDADRAFKATSSVSEASAKAARAAAEQALARALAAIPEAEAEFAEWREETKQIVEDYKRDENAAFERFHKEVQAVRA